MIVCDANIVLRYLLQDHKTLSPKATLIIENKDVFVTTEVVAEIVYVLNKVYQTSRKTIATELKILFENDLIAHQDLDFILQAIAVYEETNMDFVDCVLIVYAQKYGYVVESFDKKLNNYLKQQGL